MITSEFDLIADYFQSECHSRQDVALGIGDDGALLTVPAGSQLVVTTDMLNAGTHFLSAAPAALVGHKALASNISDLAAMGATPAWCSLALSLPAYDAPWLHDFCHGFFALARQYNIALVGGDTTRGPLSICITLHGLVPQGQAITRRGAQVGDKIYVTGDLGASAAGLGLILQPPPELSPSEQQLVLQHYLSEPRIRCGELLRAIATSAIDISDGLVGDLGHILAASHVRAAVDADKLPLSPLVAAHYPDPIHAAQLALTSGEEYELCFTLPSSKAKQVEQMMRAANVTITCIGDILAPSSTLPALTLRWQGKDVAWQLTSWDHFREGDL